MAEAVPPGDEVTQLRDEVEELRTKLSRRVAWGARARRASLALLLVLGCGLAAASVVAIWTRVTVLNTDRYVKTMAPIGRSPAVQNAVADKLYAGITSKVDIDALAREVLPDKADILAPAIANGVNSAIRSRINEFVHSPKFPQYWDEANRRAHDRVVELLTTGKSKRLTLQGDTVYLDLSPAVANIKQRLTDRGLGRVADAIPPTVDGRVTLLTSSGFSTAQGAIHRLERLSIVLPILALLFLLAHVWFSRESRRRGMLRVFLGLAVTALLLLAALGIVRTLYLNAINSEVLPRGAAEDIWDALVSVLHTTLRIAVVAAVLLAILSFLAGQPLRTAIEKGGPKVKETAARIAASPQTTWLGEHRTIVQWGIVMFGGLVLVAWSNPSAWVILIDAILIGLAVFLVAALARSGTRPAG